MQRYDLVIRNGIVATAGDVMRCDVAVKDGRIAAMGETLDSGEQEIDAIGLAKKLKVIARVGVGCDNIDIPAATAAGIAIAITGDVNSRAVAEHAVTMMLAVAKQIVPFHAAVREGDWEARDRIGAVEMDGKNLLVVGFGRIGWRVAELCTVFGVTAWVYDPFLTEAEVIAAGCRWVADLDEAIPHADFITLHIPGGAENIHLISAKRIAAMKPEAIIVNTARGQLVDEDALAEAVRAGRIVGAGTDVLSSEPPEH